MGARARIRNPGGRRADQRATPASPRFFPRPSPRAAPGAPACLPRAPRSRPPLLRAGGGWPGRMNLTRGRVARGPGGPAGGGSGWEWPVQGEGGPGWGWSGGRRPCPVNLADEGGPGRRRARTAGRGAAGRRRPLLSLGPGAAAANFSKARRGRGREWLAADLTGNPERSIVLLVGLGSVISRKLFVSLLGPEDICGQFRRASGSENNPR